MCAREGGGRWDGCVYDFAVRLRFYHYFLFLAFEFTEDYEESSPAAYSHLSSPTLDDLFIYDNHHQSCLSHQLFHPKNLGTPPNESSG